MNEFAFFQPFSNTQPTLIPIYNLFLQNLFHQKLLILLTLTTKIYKLFTMHRQVSKDQTRSRKQQSIIRNIELKQKINHAMSIIQDINSKHQLHQSTTPLQIQQPFSSIDLREHIIQFQPPSIKYQLTSSFYSTISKWLQSLYHTIAYQSFNHFYHQNLTNQQTQIFFTSNILHHIQNITQKYINKSAQSNPKEKAYQLLQFINQKSQHILTKLSFKYPKSQNQDIVTLRNFIKYSTKKSPVNQMFYGYNYKEKFIYRDEGNYQSEIMKFLNYVMDIASKTSQKQPEIPNYQAFNITTYSLFTNAGCQAFQQYLAAQIKSYMQVSTKTNIISVIGINNFRIRGEIEGYKITIPKQPLLNIYRKFKTNIQLFSNKEISEQNFRIPHPSLVGVMQKWAKQLFKTLQQFANYDQNDKTQKEYYNLKMKKVKLNKTQLKYLSKCAKDQIQRLKKNQENYKLNFTANLVDMVKEMDQQKYFQKLSQGASQKFKYKCAAYLGKYLFHYINDLIHSLLSVTQHSYWDYKYYIQNCCNQTQKYNAKQSRQAEELKQLYLISFKASDLMRAKIKTDMQSLMSILRLLLQINKQSPQFLRIVKCQEKNQRFQTDILLTVVFMNNYIGEYQFEISKTKQEKKKYYDSYNLFLSKLKNAQFSIIGQCLRIICEYNANISHLLIKEKNINPKMIKNNQKVKRKKIQFATLNYSGILLSPFQFYSKNGIQKETKICNQFNKILERSKYFNNREIKWEVGDIDKKMQIQRYTPIYRKNAGIENQKLLTKNQFIQKWNQQFDKNLPRIKKLNFKESQKQCIRFFDTLCYETFVTFVYKIESIENQQQMDKLDINQYKEFMRQFYERSFIDEQRKVKTTLESINSQKLDIMFIQQSSELLKSKLAQQPTKYKVISHPQGESMILLMESLIKLKWEDESEMQMKNNFTQQEINAFNINNDTVIMWINKYILICTHLSSKKDKNQLQSKELLNLIKNFKTIFPNHIIILGCDANTNKLGIQGNGFDIFPTKQDSFTTCKKRTVLQLQYHKANQLEKQKRNYLITNSLMIDTEVSTIAHQQIKNKEHYMPTEDHPFDHYLVKASIVNRA